MKMKPILVATLLAIFATSANAASVSLIYTGANDIDDDGTILVAAGDTLTFDLVIDFSDQITLGGGFDVNWDPTAVAFESYLSAGLGEDAFGRDPVLEDGRLYNGAVGAFNGLTVGTIGSLTFTYLGIGTNGNMITPSGTDGDSGPWIDGMNFTSIIDPEYNAIQLPVPLPAAVWFMLSGLGALFGLAHRKAT